MSETRRVLAAGVAALLVSTGAWCQSAVGETALVEAARDGASAEALALLDEGAEADAAAADGSTALLWAAHRGDAALVERLLASGADPSRANAYGATPLS